MIGFGLMVGQSGAESEGRVRRPRRKRLQQDVMNTSVLTSCSSMLWSCLVLMSARQWH